MSLLAQSFTIFAPREDALLALRQSAGALRWRSKELPDKRLYVETQPAWFGGMVISAEDAERSTKVSILGWGVALGGHELRASCESLMRGLSPPAWAQGAEGAPVKGVAYQQIEATTGTRPLWVKVVAAGEFLPFLLWAVLLVLILVEGWNPGYWLPFVCTWVPGLLIFGFVPPVKLGFLDRSHSLRVVSEILNLLVLVGALTLLWPLW